MLDRLISPNDAIWCDFKSHHSKPDWTDLTTRWSLLMSKFIFNLSESAAAELLGISIHTLRKWRTSHLPDYLYRRFGRAGHPVIKYCPELLSRWQAIDPDDVSGLKNEETQARRELLKSLAGGKGN
jgi:hypothetical protein